VAILVSGTGPYSLGESIVCLLAQSGFSDLISLDIQPNEWLRGQVHYQEIGQDLNPFAHEGILTDFSSKLEAALRAALASTTDKHLTTVIQCAGLYAAGRFLETDTQLRQKVLGVNLMGRVELLHAAMRANAELGVNNTSALSHIDVGSFQGLQMRAERALYAPSKSFGIDMAAAMAAGNELQRAIYFAPGPIDTPMLHYNHWVVKAGGPRELLDKLMATRDAYRAIFIDCSDERFRSVMSMFRLGEEDIRRFEAYKGYRREASAGAFGILSADECAQMVVDIVVKSDNNPSGIYLARRQSGAAPSVTYKGFEHVTRLGLFHIEPQSVD
jgi:short-subunit dehydrogenase